MFFKFSKYFFESFTIRNVSSSLLLIGLILSAHLTSLLAVLAEEDKPEKNKANDNYFDLINKNGILRWPASAMPLKIYIKPGDTVDGYRPVFSTLLQNAFSEWSEGTENRARFVLTNDPKNAQIICGWTSDKNDMTRLTEGGHALVIPDGHNIKRVEIIILTKTPAGENISDEFCKRVALHEIGHSLGITEHSRDINDMMYGAPPTSTKNCTLTSRDKKTLIALYDLNQTKVDQSHLDIGSLLPAKDNQSNLARIIRLNAEASQAMQSKNLALAVSKLEQAHKIDPSNDLINSNLGAVYGNCAMVACLIKDTQRAQTYFNKALPLLASGANKDSYLSVLGCYENFLLQSNRPAEAEKIRNQIKTLQH